MRNIQFRHQRVLWQNIFAASLTAIATIAGVPALAAPSAPLSRTTSQPSTSASSSLHPSVVPTTPTNAEPQPVHPISPIGFNIKPDGSQDSAHPISNPHLLSNPGVTSTAPSIGTLPILEDPVEEKVIDHDNRVPITNTTEAPFRWIGQLTFTTPQGLTGRCTGALIGKDTVLTAGHCLAQGSRNIAFSAGKNANGTPFGSVKATQVWYDEHPKQLGHDWGVIKLSEPIGATVGWFGTNSPNLATLHNQYASVIGYPSDKPTDTLWKDRNRIAKVTERQVFYITDTFGGQSGSPVLSDDAAIYAIHTSGKGQQNWGTLLTRELFNIAANLAT